MHILTQNIHRLFQEAAGNDGSAGSNGADNSNPPPDPAAVEQRAREMGWAPKEQWRGNPDHWIDASTFVQRGEQVLPILQANSRKDRAELENLRRQMQQQSAQLQAANESIQVLTNLSTEQSRNAAKEKRRELLRQQAEARSSGNTDLEIDIGEQIADVTAQINASRDEESNEGERPARGKKPNGKQGSQQPQSSDSTTNNDPTADPQYQAWLGENSWYGTDRRRTALAVAIGQELRSDPANNHLQGRAFFDKVTAEVNKVLAPPRTPSKVESGANGGNGAQRNNEADPASGKTYADLPQDAKEACERFAKQVVGEGRAFKDIASWRKHYITQYFNS